jgi:hypothetical protein
MNKCCNLHMRLQCWWDLIHGENWLPASYISYYVTMKIEIVGMFWQEPAHLVELGYYLYYSWLGECLLSSEWSGCWLGWPCCFEIHCFVHCRFLGWLVCSHLLAVNESFNLYMYIQENFIVNKRNSMSFLLNFVFEKLHKFLVILKYNSYVFIKIDQRIARARLL